MFWKEIWNTIGKELGKTTQAQITKKIQERELRSVEFCLMKLSFNYNI